MRGHEVLNPGSLDEGQYARHEIRKYEAIYGRDFISPGGLQYARKFVAALQLKPGALVLDAGCGIGGSAFLMAREYRARVTGIDLSANMITFARQRCCEYGLDAAIELVHGDCLDVDAREHYDAVYSRDAFLHVHDKRQLFGVLLHALKPGGQILITDYCAAPAPWSVDFSEYVAQRGYDLHSVDGYAQLLRGAGFEDVRAHDLSDAFAEIHRAELERLAGTRISDVDREALQGSWRLKLQRIRGGEQRWGMFQACRPQ